MTDLAIGTGTLSALRVGGYPSSDRSDGECFPATPRLPAPQVGTGGVASLAFVLQPYGYAWFCIVSRTPTEPETFFSHDMARVKAGFGRTMSCLPGIFGVSRQTLYNWLDGQTPKEKHQKPLRQLAEAAAIFIDLAFKPTPAMLGQTLDSGKSFIQLIASGADGRDTAKKLVHIVRRGRDSRAKLDALLAGRKAHLDSSDFGASLSGEQV
jgi:hypothetical protein